MRAEPTSTAPPLLLVAADQVLISGLSLALSAAFIVSGAKTEYAWYSLALSFALLLGGLQNAVILTPALTLDPRSEADSGRNFLTALAAHNWSFGICAAALMGVGVACWAHGSHAGWLLLGVAGGVAVLGSWSRELRRALSLASSRPAELLLGDGAMVVVALLLVGLLWFASGGLTAWVALLATGLAGLATGVAFGRSRMASGAGGREVRSAILEQARWTAPSVLVSWGQASSYPIVVAAMVSIPSVADLAASRLLIMPGLLLGSAWARYKLPVASRALREHPESSGRMIAARLLGATMVAVAVNIAGILVIQSVGLLSQLPLQFQGIHKFSVPWIAYLIATTFRTAVSTVAQAALRFRDLFIWGVLAASLSIVLVMGMVARLGPSGAPIGLAISELMLGVGIWVFLGRRLKPGEGAAGRGGQIEARQCAP